MASKALPYKQEEETCKKFLQEFQLRDADDSIDFKYLNMLQKVANRETDVVAIDMDDLQEYDDNLSASVARNTLRYSTLFANVIDEMDMKPTVELQNETLLDVFFEHRNTLTANTAAAETAAGGAEAGTTEQTRARYPKSLLRRFQVVFNPPRLDKARSIRTVDARNIGGMVTVEGIVTRATAVKPRMVVATYACDRCGSEIFQEITGPNFKPLTTCVSQECTTNRTKGRLHMLTRGSKFERFQEFKIQELANNVPTGHIPRSMTIYARGTSTRACSPGDRVTVSGVFLPTPYTGYKAIRAGLLSDTYLEAHVVAKEKKTHIEQVLTDEMLEEIEEQAQNKDTYEKLAASIAPEIYGHEDVKKALLLLLVGGVDRRLKDGMKIRGDINICLMGDPGVAKSQMLKKVADLSPRGVYTTGRGSSGVGLTAAVTKDPLTNELVLEGGALVLSDMGICCIDEFDKMEEGDRTAIHEVMEQQTISIAKGGINTTLNARSAILAAANPLYGRYNTKKSATANINLPPALLSRFDLIFLMLDRPDMDADLRLANHITYVHSHNDFPALDHEPLEKTFVRNYISVAKRYQPYVSEELVDYIVGIYINMREESQSEKEITTFVSVRTLLGILRLASALARLRFSHTVDQSDVEEALRLTHESKAQLRQEKEKGTRGEDHAMTSIYKILRDMGLQADKKTIKMNDARQRALAKGYTIEEFDACIDEYENLNVWTINASRTRITI